MALGEPKFDPAKQKECSHGKTADSIIIKRNRLGEDHIVVGLKKNGKSQTIKRRKTLSEIIESIKRTKSAEIPAKPTIEGGMKKYDHKKVVAPSKPSKPVAKHGSQRGTASTKPYQRGTTPPKPPKPGAKYGYQRERRLQNPRKNDENTRSR